jgi:5'-methylthioadenosine phosphorylase
MEQVKIGVIGGSGFAPTEKVETVDQVEVKTPFGKPSSIIDIVRVGEHPVALLFRHGRPPAFPPHEVNARANIYALKSLGVERVIALLAVGSLREEMRPLDIVVPHQAVDRTRGRVSTFFEGDLIVHVEMAHPFCADVRKVLLQCLRGTEVTAHDGGVYVCMEGPQFSTRAESNMHRMLGFDVVGMTLFPEAKLAREAEICYAAMALATDYDVWHDHEQSVSHELVLANSRRMQQHAQEALGAAIPKLAVLPRGCSCMDALRDAFGSDISRLSDDTNQRLGIILSKYTSSDGA